MNNPFSKNMIDRMFKQVDNVVWDLMSGSKVGFKTAEGIATCDLNLTVDPADPTTVVLEAPEAQISVNLFDDFGMAVPAFAQSTPVTSINLGDLIYSSSQGRIMGWVVKKSESGKTFKILKQDGTRTEWSPPKVQMLGFESGVMVVRSLMNMLPNATGAAGTGGLLDMQNGIMQMMMMSSMMGGDGDSEGMLKDMMPLMLMGQLGGAGGGMAGMQNMLPMLMMSKMMGNKNSGSSSSGRNKNNFFNN